MYTEFFISLLVLYGGGADATSFGVYGGSGGSVATSDGTAYILSGDDLTLLGARDARVLANSDLRERHLQQTTASTIPTMMAIKAPATMPPKNK